MKLATGGVSQALAWVAVLAGLYAASLRNYLLFHGLVEVFSIAVAFAMFTIAWNSDRFIRNGYLLIVGVAYVFIGFLDLLHTLAYKGMGVFSDYDYYANQLWVATRYLEAITLVVAFGTLRWRNHLSPGLIFAPYLCVTAAIVGSIFWWKTFPVCFVEGIGLTPFKKNSEYVICGILGAALSLLYRYRAHFDRRIFRLLALSIICTIISELSFTFYVSNYGIWNMVGHYFKLSSFYLLYRALVATGIQEPYALIFSELKEKEKELEVQAVTDGLTGAFNRRAAFALLERALSHGQRAGETTSIAYLDLDHLKDVNDRYGHAAGDEMILAFCDAARDAIRQSDSLCRLGGDEFLLVLPCCAESEAGAIVGRLRQALSARPMEPGRSAVEFSWGVACNEPGARETPDQLVDRADSRMYEQKAGKRGTLPRDKRRLAAGYEGEP